MKTWHSLEGDVGEQRGGGEDGGDPTAEVRDEGQNPVVLRVDVRRNSIDVLNTRRDGPSFDIWRPLLATMTSAVIHGLGGGLV